MNEMHLVGGTAKRLPLSKYYIKKAEASNTRLLGAVGLFLHWKIKPEILETLQNKDLIVTDFYQSFCFDLEEGELSRAEDIDGGNSNQISRLKNSLFEPLGGSIVRLAKAEVFWLLANYPSEKDFEDKTLPVAIRSVLKLALEKPNLDEDALAILRKKLCAEINTPYAYINYYLMRSVAKDKEGLLMLKSPNAKEEDLQSLGLSFQADLIHNKITKLSQSYICESILDSDKGGFLMLSEIYLDDRGITKTIKKDAFHISDWEYINKTNRGEYLTYFDISDDPDRFADKLERALRGACVDERDSGILYVKYLSENSYMDNPVFHISDDLDASFFITNTGELLIAAFNFNSIVRTNVFLEYQDLTKHLELCHRYNFANPVLGPFIESGFDSFEEFLNEIL